MTCNGTLRSGALTASLELESDFVNCEKCGLIKFRKWHDNFKLCSNLIIPSAISIIKCN